MPIEVQAVTKSYFHRHIIDQIIKQLVMACVGWTTQKNISWKLLKIQIYCKYHIGFSFWDTIIYYVDVPVLV